MNFRCFGIRVERFASEVSACSLELLALELSAVVELSSPKWLLDETWPTFVSMWFCDSMSMSLEFGISFQEWLLDEVLVQCEFCFSIIY